MTGAIFFDRDNTLVIDKGYTWKVSDFAFFLDSAEALAFLNSYKIPVFIVTNQSGIARGYFDEADMFKYNKHFTKQVALRGGNIWDIAYCPHHPDYPEKTNTIKCSCRKPLPGMIKMMSYKWQIDLNKSIMIGDKETDIQAGEAAGCLKSFLIERTESRVDLCKLIISKYFIKKT